MFQEGIDSGMPTELHNDRQPRGSEWRKWDLHTHIPGTSQNDAYTESTQAENFQRFARTLEDSDVDVFGLTDYFKVDKVWEFIQYFKREFPDSEKKFLVNLEVRLNEIVNKDFQVVDFHILFSDKVAQEEMNEFLRNLPTQTTDDRGRALTCSELSTTEDFNSASVSRGDIEEAFVKTFGKKVETTDMVLYIVPANNNGIRGDSSIQRKGTIANEIDKLAHAVFGKNPANTDWFLRTDRFGKAGPTSVPKPVFGGCDAHSFEQLDDWLGKTLRNEGTNQVATWIKSDPTYAGLLQTLVEPSERVRLQEEKPDSKEPYKVINAIRFTPNDNFPEEIRLNSNLNAIIGSRSSGKSALLAHIAYSVDPLSTKEAQVEAEGLSDTSAAGPAAGFRWSEVESLNCEVEWMSGPETSGKVIYVPQNSLNRLSRNTESINRKIRPALLRHHPQLGRVLEKYEADVEKKNNDIREHVQAWFSDQQRLADLSAESKDIGDLQAIQQQLSGIEVDIKEAQSVTNFSEEESADYKAISKKIELAERVKLACASELEALEVTTEGDSDPDYQIGTLEDFRVEILVDFPGLDLTPEFLARVRAIKAAAEEDVREEITSMVEDLVRVNRNTLEVAVAAADKLRVDNEVLFEKYEANRELVELQARRKRLSGLVDGINRLENQMSETRESARANVSSIESLIQERLESGKKLESAFDSSERRIDDLLISLEMELSCESVELVSSVFDQRFTGEFIPTKGADVDLVGSRNKVSRFLNSVHGGETRVKKGTSKLEASTRVLQATEEIRFAATLSGDKIGGFSTSSMTPGKQALFALTLLLNEAQEPWPLLIDQPEDDLDSRSIYEVVVPYIIHRKRDRQIIMVSHNANLVVGADSELVVVANRDADSDRNPDRRTFDYLGGSLEHSMKPMLSAEYALDRAGIREHVCQILDGGIEAFEKRRTRYMR